MKNVWNIKIQMAPKIRMRADAVRLRSRFFQQSEDSRSSPGHGQGRSCPVCRSSLHVLRLHRPGVLGGSQRRRQGWYCQAALLRTYDCRAELSLVYFDRRCRSGCSECCTTDFQRFLKKSVESKGGFSWYSMIGCSLKIFD